MPQAILLAINEKDTTAGKMYDLVFSDNNKVGAGKFLPKGATVGKYYSYEIKMNGNFKNLAPGGLNQLPDPPAGTVASAPAAASSSPAKSYGNAASGGGWDDRQEIISRQAAANTALTFVKMLVDADALPVPKALKSDKKADAMEAIVHEYIGKFYKLATGKEFVFTADMQETADLAIVDAATDWSE